MKAKFFYQYEKKNHIKSFTILFILLALGIIAGCIYCLLLKPGSDISVHNYLTSYINLLGDKITISNCIKNSLIESLRLFVIIFFSSFFRFGGIIVSAVVFIKGFSIGFTTAAFLKYFSLKGILLCFSKLPTFLVFIPILIFFASMCIKTSRYRIIGEKKSYKKHIIMSICCLTIFCAAGLFDAIVSTTFMKIILQNFL